jgi:hypothetical protein
LECADLSALWLKAAPRRRTPKQSAVLTGFFFISLSRTGTEATLITLAQLSSRATLEGTFIRTQTSAPINGKHTLNFRMWPGNNVHAYQFTNPARGRGTSVRRSLHCTDITTHEYRHVACSDVFLAEQLHVRGLNHRVGSFNRAHESLGLDHSECF